MAALPAGVQYDLSSEQSYKENKELVFVKLTDSALKAIEDFLRNNRDKLAKPKIQFLPGNEGKISIPAGGNGSAGEATFHFSINSNAEMEGPQGSFECVRGGGAKRLESYGPLPRRMRVQANDDSYEATKDRMARTVAAEQSKCTRVIKPNQTDIGRRVKVRHSLYNSSPSAPAPTVHLPDRPERPEHRPEPRQEHRPEPRQEHRPEPRQEHRPEPRQEHRPEPRQEHRPERSERPESRPDRPDRAESRPERPDRPDRTERADKPTAPRPAPQARPPGNPDLARRSIEERLIQLLALKPFKKPELYARLNSEGIKEKERALVNKILPNIGTMKDNCYHLRRHIWNDVNEDWPFYSEDEKRALKRRKPANLTPPLSSDGSPNASAGGEPPACKKRRISHYRRAAASPASSGYGTSGASSGERHCSDNEDDRTNNVKKDNGYTLSFNTIPTDLCSAAVPKTNGFRNSPPPEQTCITEKDITNNETIENTELSSAPDENMSDLAEIERQWPGVSGAASRRAYKKEFSVLYGEYVALHGRVARVADTFAELERQLHAAPPSSPARQSIEQRIVDEYRRVRGDEAYQRDRRRVNYLHRKLTHIKQCVHHYDQMRNLKPERVATATTTQAY